MYWLRARHAVRNRPRVGRLFPGNHLAAEDSGSAAPRRAVAPVGPVRAYRPGWYWLSRCFGRCSRHGMDVLRRRRCWLSQCRHGIQAVTLGPTGFRKHHKKIQRDPALIGLANKTPKLNGVEIVPDYPGFATEAGMEDQSLSEPLRVYIARISPQA